MAKFIELKDEKEREELGELITDMWDEDNEDRDEWLKCLPKWLDAYQGRPQQKNLPWKGASNLFVPMTATAVDAIHPKLMAALFKPTPICSFKAQEASDVELAKKNEDFLDYVIREECSIFPVADRFILNTLIYGIQVVKTSWDLQLRNQRVKHEFPVEQDPIEAIQTILAGEQAVADAINRLTDEDYEVILDDRKVKLDVRTTKDSLIIYTEREEIVKDQAVIDVINAEDIAFNSDCSYNLQEADHILERYYLTLDQIKRNIKSGLFSPTGKKAEVEEELEKLAGSNISGGDTTVDQKEYRESVTGASEIWRQSSPYDKIELVDAYLKYDIDDDGYEEDILVTIPMQKPSLILRIHRLEDVYAHGMKPYTLFYLNPVGKTVWAHGVPQMVEALQAEINIIHNQRNDAGQINNTPYGWFVPGAGMPKERMPIDPGFLIPVGDVNQVKMHQPGNYTAWAVQEEQLLYTLFERRTKVSDLTLGRAGENQGASRTATGVQALSAQQATGFDIVIRRFQESWKSLLQQVMALYQEYMPDDRMVRITGKYGDPDYVVTKDQLSHRMDMQFTGNSLNTDREVERNTLTFMAQSAMAPPSLGFLMQIGVMDPQSVAEWYRYFFEVFDVPNIERMIKIPKMPIILKPDEIMNRLMSGEKLLPRQGEDHDAVIMMITDYLNSSKAITLEPELLALLQGQVPLRQQQKVNEQIQQMMQMMQMMQMTQMGGPMGPGAPMPPGLGGAPPRPPQAPGGMVF